MGATQGPGPWAGVLLSDEEAIQIIAVLADVLDGHDVRDAVSAAWSLLGNRLGAQAGVADPSPRVPGQSPQAAGRTAPPLGQPPRPSKAAAKLTGSTDMQIQHRRAERPASWRHCAVPACAAGARLAFAGGPPSPWTGGWLVRQDAGLVPLDRAHDACALGAVLCAVREASIAGVARPVMPFPLPYRRCRGRRVTSSGPGRCLPHSRPPARPPRARRGRSGWCGA